MKDYSQIISRMQDALWLTTKPNLTLILEIVNRHINGDLLSDEEIQARIEAANNGDRNHQTPEVAGGVGILPIYGSIFPKSNLMTQISGATSLETLSSNLNDLMANDQVKSIIMDIDSPGGIYEMTMEAGNLIREARDTKPIYAVANAEANSGAYWLASQASKFYVTPSGKVGSIGVYTVHEDRSEQDKREGRKVSIISAGEFKAAGNPHEPLTEEARSYIQEHIDEAHEQFKLAVMKGRGISRKQVEEFADGRVFSASKAEALGMVDGIKTLDSVMDGLLAEHYMPQVRTGLSAAVSRVHSNAAMLSNSLDIKVDDIELEHSEPGTGLGGEPVPREQPSDRGNSLRGSRRETPPIVAELEEEVEELLGAIKAAGVDIPTDLDTSDSAAVTEFAVAQFGTLSDNLKVASDELAPLRAAAESAKAATDFRTQYPEQAAKLESLEKKDRENDAKAFADSFARFSKVDAPTEKTPYGFSGSVLTMVEDFALTIMDRTAKLTDLKDLLTNIGNNGIVDYSERGSSRHSEFIDSDLPVDTSDMRPRQAFAAVVKHYMEADSLEYKAALDIASDKHPELAAAYMHDTPNAGPSN